MKKITLLMAFLAVSLLSNSQTSCANAPAISTILSNTVTAYGASAATPDCTGYTTQATGAAWYTYTPAATGVLNLNTDFISNGGIDTQVSLYTGSCASLVCEGFLDDVSANNFATNGDFSVTAGTTYYIVWENRWDTTVPFDFTATFTSVTSPPNSVTMPSPADTATGVAIDPTDNNADGTPDNAVSISWTPDPNGAPATEYDIFFGQNPTMLQNLTANTTFTGTGARITGSLYNTTYYWQIVAINGQGSSTNNPIWSYTTEVATGTAPSNATTPSPIDGATNVAIDTADSNMDGNPDNSVTVSWVQDATGQQPNAYTINLGTDPTMLQTLSTTFTGLGARFLNQNAGTTYYWQIIPTNNGVEALNQPIWSYTTAGTASNEDNNVTFFTVSPNPSTGILNVDSSEQIESFKIYNSLGQSLNKNVNFDNATMNISNLRSGIYFLQITSDQGSVQTEQIIKK